MDLFGDHKAIGIVVVGGEECTLYTKKLTQIVKVRQITVCRQKSQKAGGQSAPRFQRIRLNQISEYSDKIITEVNLHFPAKIIEDIVVIGNGSIFMDVGNAPSIKPRLRNIIRSDRLDTSTILQCITELKIIPGLTKSKAALDMTLSRLSMSDPCIVYGVDAIKHCFELRIVETVLAVNPGKVEEFDMTGINIEYIDDPQLDTLGGILITTYYDPSMYFNDNTHID
jgi:peptide subunit release factor 1 (eRF1)